MSRIKDKQIVKQLKSQLKKVEGEIEAINVNIKNKQKEINQKSNITRSLNDKIKNLNISEELDVSDHAIVRYLERVKGVNIDEIKKEILNDNIVRLIETLGGSGKYPNDNFTIVMKDNMVITIQ